MIVLLSICAVVVLLSLAGLVWDVASGLITTGVDGLMLLMVCLLMAGIFGRLGFTLAKQAGWMKPLPFLRRRRAEGEAPADSPAGGRK